MSEKLLKDLFFKEYYFSDFYFFNVGYEMCQSGHRFGPSLRDNYIVHFVISGKGRYTVNDITHHLGVGDFFLIRPNELVDYEADVQDPWEYYWIGFSGTKVKEILHTNGIGAKDYIGQVGAQKELQEKFAHFMEADFFDDAKKLANQALFYDIFSFFKIHNENMEMGVRISRTKKYSEAFLLYVGNNYYREDLTIEEIAKSMYLHPAYFSQVIKEESITLFWSPWGSKDSGCSKIKIAKVKACCYSTFTLAIYCFMDFATNVKKKKKKRPILLK